MNQSSGKTVKIRTLVARFTHWWTVRKVGMMMLTLAALIGVLGYANQHPGEFEPETLVTDFYANVSTELASIAITVLIIDHLYELREKRREEANLKARLISRLGSRINDIAVRAIEELEEREWLYDGTLRGALLYEANLAGANLLSANLSETNLDKARLNKANLRRADLHMATLQEADMREANLEEANLSNADLSNSLLTKAYLREADLHNADLSFADLLCADLRYANLKETKVTLKQLARSESLKGATMPDGSRYDGCLCLEGDLNIARRKGIDISSPEAMAEFYDTDLFSITRCNEVTLEIYLKGQRWARGNLSNLRSGPANDNAVL